MKQKRCQKCTECGTILSFEELNIGFCASCDPVILSDTEKEINAENRLKHEKDVFPRRHRTK